MLTNGGPKFVGNLSPDDVTLVLTPETDTVTAGLTIREIDPTSLLKLLGNVLNVKATQYEFGYGGSDPADYLDDNTFSASANPEGTVTEWRWVIFKHTTPVDVEGRFVSGSPALPNGLCTDCDFIKYGTWGAALTSQQNPNQSQTLGGWWVAGDITTASQLDQLANTHVGIANYAGKAVGDVFSKSGGTWTQSIETGDMTMSWDFADRKGQLNINNFDGRNFGGEMCGKSSCLKGNNHFAGSLRQTDGLGGANRLNGAAAGSFVNKGSIPAGGVIGNFGVGNNNWKASGIWGGARP